MHESYLQWTWEDWLMRKKNEKYLIWNLRFVLQCGDVELEFVSELMVELCTELFSLVSVLI